jgi:hypothetical protein
MRKQASVAGEWTGKFLLHLLAYAVLSYTVRYMIGGSFRLLIKAGANLPPQLLFQHFLVVAFVGGLLAGVVGPALLRAMFLLRTNLDIASTAGWKDPKAWTWLVPTIALAIGVAGWIGSQASVLTSSGINFSSFFATFFGNGCDLRYGLLGACLTQVSYTHAWVGTIGYSASAFIPLARQQVEREAELGNPQELNSESSLPSGDKLHCS